MESPERAVVRDDEDREDVREDDRDEDLLPLLFFPDVPFRVRLFGVLVVVATSNGPLVDVARPGEDACRW